MSARQAIAAVCDAAAVSEPRGWGPYFECVQHWGARTDLTSARSDVELAEILFLDAAHLSRAGWDIGSTTVIDVGAGAGAPTIPLLLSNERLEATLVEPRRIRAAFLRSAIGSLDLAARARVLERRIDSRPRGGLAAGFDLALSRATFDPGEWLRIGVQLAHLVWVLTAGTTPELPEGVRLTDRLEYAVPSTGAPRVVLAYRRA